MDWKFKSPKPDEIKQFVRELKISPELAAVFINRDISLEIAKQLETEPYKMIDKPLPIANIKEGASYILSCIKENRPIYIFADYDVDGLTAGYIAHTFLSAFQNITVYVYYPEREEGYGLNLLFCDKLIKKYRGISPKPLVITVDNGITKKTEVAALQAANFKVLVTDHHLPVRGTLPDCICVDPYLGSVGKNLCGASVFWNIARYIENQINVGHTLTDILLYAAAIGTLSDVMPLDPYNIALTKLGLFAMNSSKCTENIKKIKESLPGAIDGETITWKLAPLLNACGRMGDVNLGASFFLSRDENTLESVLEEARNKNEQRKKLEATAIKNVLKNLDESHEVIIVIGDEYPVGIHGLIAGQIVNKLNKPTIVVNTSSNTDVYSGSCRSNTVPINKLLQEEKELGHIISCGGHAFACGVSIEKNKLKDLQESLDMQIMRMKTTGEYDMYVQEPDLVIDGTLLLSDVNNILRSELNKYAYDKKTWGSPIWAFTGLSLQNINVSKSNPNNVKLTVADKNNHISSFWAWGMANKVHELEYADQIDIAGELTEDFMYPKRTTLRIIDVRASAPSSVSC